MEEIPKVSSSQLSVLGYQELGLRVTSALRFGNAFCPTPIEMKNYSSIDLALYCSKKSDRNNATNRYKLGTSLK